MAASFQVFHVSEGATVAYDHIVERNGTSAAATTVTTAVASSSVQRVMIDLSTGHTHEFSVRRSDAAAESLPSEPLSVVLMSVAGAMLDTFPVITYLTHSDDSGSELTSYRWTATDSAEKSTEPAELVMTDEATTAITMPIQAMVRGLYGPNVSWNEASFPLELRFWTTDDAAVQRLGYWRMHLESSGDVEASLSLSKSDEGCFDASYDLSTCRVTITCVDANTLVAPPMKSKYFVTWESPQNPNSLDNLEMSWSGSAPDPCSLIWPDPTIEPLTFDVARDVGSAPSEANYTLTCTLFCASTDDATRKTVYTVCGRCSVQLQPVLELPMEPTIGFGTDSAMTGSITVNWDTGEVSMDITANMRNCMKACLYVTWSDGTIVGEVAENDGGATAVSAVTGITIPFSKMQFTYEDPAVYTALFFPTDPKMDADGLEVEHYYKLTGNLPLPTTETAGTELTMRWPTEPDVDYTVELDPAPAGGVALRYDADASAVTMSSTPILQHPHPIVARLTAATKDMTVVVERAISSLDDIGKISLVLTGSTTNTLTAAQTKPNFLSSSAGKFAYFRAVASLPSGTEQTLPANARFADLSGNGRHMTSGAMTNGRLSGNAFATIVTVDAYPVLKTTGYQGFFDGPDSPVIPVVGSWTKMLVVNPDPMATATTEFYNYFSTWPSSQRGAPCAMFYTTNNNRYGPVVLGCMKYGMHMSGPANDVVSGLAPQAARWHIIFNTYDAVSGETYFYADDGLSVVASNTLPQTYERVTGGMGQYVQTCLLAVYSGSASGFAGMFLEAATWDSALTVDAMTKEVIRIKTLDYTKVPWR
jgi:hypothetical protein